MSRILNVNTTRAMINCFVCDQRIAGEKVNLATSLSTHSKVTLPEKISQLIGDDYVVAVTEQDCVCKRCASLLNHMDKLENELTLVKRALSSNISHKYKINFADAQVVPQTLANGLKTDSGASDYEDEGRKAANTSTVEQLNNSALIKKKPVPVNKVVAPPKPAKPAENVTKLKIYKCGFCSYQSKELSNVRMHMKIHIKANKSENEPDKGTAASSPLLAPKTPVSVRRRVFRCQVCSASFDDRNKCLEHISRDHTTAGRKLAEQKQTQEESHQQPIAPKPSAAATAMDLEVAPATEQQEAEAQELQQQKEGFDDSGANQEEMDTSEAPPTIGLYSCDSCPSTFDNDVNLANHVNEHVKGDGTKVIEDEAAAGKSQTDFSQLSSQETQGANEDETPKDSNIGNLDIEAMIAALHSDGPDSGPGDSMPSI